MIKTKLALFAVALAATFGAGAALGAAVGPIDVGGEDPPTHERHGAPSDEHQ